MIDPVDAPAVASPSSAPLGDATAWRHAVLPAVLLSATFVAMAWLTWGRWPDVLVDFGRELYVPWRITQGAVLGRDLEWYVTGPLPPYVNAALFAAVGPSLRALVLLNLAVLAAITALLYRLLAASSGRVGATAGCLAFLGVFAFGQYLPGGNYNYVTPYSHGATHGMALALAGLALAAVYLRTRAGAAAVAAGLCLGLVFLTKPELFVATAAALGVAAIAAPRGSRREDARTVLGFGAAAAAPVAVAWAALATRMPASDAWGLVIAPWRLLSGSAALANRYYLEGTGLDAPARNLGLLALTTAIAAAAVAGAWAADARWGARLRHRSAALATGVVAGAAPLLLLVPMSAWDHAARPLPALALASLAGFGLAALRARRRGATEDRRARLATGLVFSTFAAALLLKMGLNARVFHYGFLLAMPAAVLSVALLVGVLPALARARHGGGDLLRGVALGAIAVFVAASFRDTAMRQAPKRYPVGAGADAFLADGRGRYVAEALRWIDRFGPPGGTLAVLPEGVMVNYLARRASTVPYLSFLSDSLAYYGGEEPILRAYLAAPPDQILLVHRDSSEYGPRFFGRDYAQGLARWISTAYEPVAFAGAEPFQGDEYGMVLLRRRR
jgi:hypothetical protein